MGKQARKKVVANVSVGKPETGHTASSHTPGVKQGNAGGHEARPGARRATSINPDEHEPIDPRMPKLTPP